MSCIEQQRLIAFVDEQATVEDDNAIRAHVEQCSTCRQRVDALRGLWGDIASGGVTGNADFTRNVMQAIHGDRPTQTRRRPMAAAAAVAVVGLGVMFAVQLRPDDDGQFQARGGATSTAQINADAYVVAEQQHRPLKSGARLPNDAAFAFRYTNLTTSQRYLMAFAVDSAGEVHWFFPAYRDARSNPSALVSPPKSRRVALPQVVQPDQPPAGAFRLVLIQSKQQYRVKAVERRLKGKTAKDTLEGLFAEDHVNSWLVQLER